MSNLLNSRTLKELLDLCCSGVGVVNSCAKVGIQSPSTFFTWQAKAKEAERLNDFSSVFYIQGWGGEPDDFWNRLLLVARARRTLLLEGEIIEAAALSQPGPIVIQDGKVCWAENEDFVGMSDAEMLGLGFDPVKDRIARDKLGRPIPLRHSPIPAPATLRAKAIASLHPVVWGEKTEQTVSIQGRVDVVGHNIVEARKGAPAPDESDSIKAMRERLLDAAKAHLSDPARITRPVGPPIKPFPSDAGMLRQGDPRERTNRDDPMDDVNSVDPGVAERQRALPAPDYGRPAKGLNTDDQTGRGKAPPGGFSVVR